VPAGLSRVAASRHNLGAGRDGPLELVDDLLALHRRHHRADVGVGVGRVADNQRVGVLHEGGEIVVVDVLHHVEALGRGADLPGVEVGGPGAAFGGDPHPAVARHVGTDDERVLAAHLQVDARDPLRSRRGDLLAGADRAGEGDAVDALVGGDRSADLPVASQQVDGAAGKVVDASGEHQGRDRCQLRRLADGGVAGRQRRGELPGQQQQRVIPGHDAADDPDRVLDDQRELCGLDRGDHPAGRVAPDLRVVVEGRGGPADLVGVLDQRLAALQGHHLGELIGVRPQPVGDLVKHLPALDRGRPAPLTGRLAGGGDRRVDLLGGCLGDAGDGLLGGRVLDLERLSLTGELLAADQEACLGLSHPRLPWPEGPV